MEGGGDEGNGGGLKSSRDTQREETLKMTQFITITATKEREGKNIKKGDAKESKSMYCNTLARLKLVHKISCTNIIRGLKDGVAQSEALYTI